MKLAKGKRKDFKTQEAYLKDIYMKNIDILSKGYSNSDKFIKAVEARKKQYGTNVTGAINKILNSETFIPYTQRASDQVKKSILKFGKWKDFQNMTRDERGRFTGYDRNKLEYIGDKQYIYANKILIDFNNSPADVTLTLL